MRPMFCVPMWLPIAFTRTLHENVDARAHLAEGTEHQADGPAVRCGRQRLLHRLASTSFSTIPPPFFGIDALLVRWHFGGDAPLRVIGLRLRGSGGVQAMANTSPTCVHSIVFKIVQGACTRQSP